MGTAPLVIMVGADKGGVGKTIASRLLVEYLISKELRRRVFDTEHPKGGLVRFASAEVIDITSASGQMRVFDALSGVTVIDVRAGTLSKTLAMLDRTNFLNDVKEGLVNLALLHVIGPTVQSLGEVQDTASAIGGASQHFVVKNHVADFEWEVSGDHGLRTIVVPHLEDLACETIDGLGASFSSFCSDPKQSRILRGHTRAWMKNVWENFDKVGIGQLAEAAREA